MSMDLLLELAWKSTVCAGLTLLVNRVLARRSAAEKSVVAQIGLFALLLLPVAVVGLPALEFPAPAPVLSTIDNFSTRLVPASEAGPPAAPSLNPGFDWKTLAAIVYFAPAAGLLGLLLLGVLQLQMVRRRAEVFVDSQWLTALAAAQRRLGFKHGTALLTSNELSSPISWGIVRPIIIIDAATASGVDRAEAIIAHELAHVHRLDWLKLLLGRVATALFWFNPLVWLLAARSHQLCEEAADDAVIRSDIGRADYAELLVSAVRHAKGSLLLTANGVAPSRSSISKRVTHVLDTAQLRSPARRGWIAASLGAGLVVNGALAAAEPMASEARVARNSGAGANAAARLERIDSAHTRTIGKAIRARDWEARRVQGPTTFNEPAAVQPLVEATRDDNSTVRRIAVWGLSEMRPPVGSSASGPVARLLADPSAAVRGEAARALGDFGAADQAEAVARLLQDPDPRVRRQAAHALGDLQSPATRSALERAQQDPDPGVSSKAQWALRQVQEAERILQRYANH